MKALTYLSFNCLVAILQLVCATSVMAQRDYTVVKPRERAATEKITVTRKATQANKGILAVVLEPVIAGKVVITDTKGNTLQAEADNKRGIAEFELRRNQSYSIKASSPGYLNAESKFRLIKSSDTLRLKLIAQFARIELPGTPAGAEVFIDGQARAKADQSGRVVIDNLEPGNHTLLVRHTEYNDYETPLKDLEAGTGYPFFALTTLLTKVAKLTINSLPNATVLIDGDVRGRINADGQVQINYQLTQAAEHSIAIELPGYQTWTRKELLTPGPRTLSAKLDPIVTSAGVTDGFASLAQWSYPATWKIVSQKGKELDNSKLQVSGPGIGVLKEKTYRDFTVTFTVWLSDEKGASWIVRTDPTGPNYYLFHLSGLKAGELTPRRLYTYRVKDGQTNEVETPTPITLDFKEKESYYITVSVHGNKIEHTIQAISTAEESGASYTDTFTDKDLFLYGSFGFTSFKGEVFLVDDLLLAPEKE